MLKLNILCLFLTIIVLFIHCVTSSDDPFLKKAVKEFYKNCEKPNTPVKPSCTGCPRKWCAGVFGKNCIDKGACTFAGAISENETHFEYTLLANTIDYELKENETYSQIALVSPFLPMHQSQAGPTCKAELRMSDFKFLYFKEIRANIGGVASKNSGVTAGVTYKANWAKDCQKLREEHNKRSNEIWGINIYGEYYAPLLQYLDDYVDRNPDFSDGTKYNISDGFLILNFDQIRNSGITLLSKGEIVWLLALSTVIIFKNFG